MKKAPKVLTRMRLSCCWGDNLDEKELNDIVDYINELEQQCKKQKEVIDKAIKYVEDYTSGERIITYEQYKSELLDILKEVSE
jgi:hypothetical protein